MIGPTIERYGYRAECVISITLVNNETTSVTIFVILPGLQHPQPHVPIILTGLPIKHHCYSDGFVIDITLANRISIREYSFSNNWQTQQDFYKEIFIQ